jgi:EAL domain-containing protein (putative c-di-GMP-specific phosphodiesterase class I)
MMAALSGIAARTGAPPGSGLGGIERVLRTVRAHLGMDVAFVSEFVGDRRRFRHVDSGVQSPVREGGFMPLDEGYCKRIVDGALPELIPDTSALPEAVAIPATRTVPIGAHIGVPLRLGNGRVFGTLCCFSFHADSSLNDRDLNMVRAFAELVAYHIEAELENERDRQEKVERIGAILCSGEPSMVYQPVFKLDDMSVKGAEALSRFRSEPVRAPDLWFAEADEVGLKTELELKAMRKALAGFGPAWKRGLHLALNSSPQTILSSNLARVLQQAPPERVILEITEHDHIDDYEALRRALAPLQAAGVRIAIDDAGSGYASMRHILNIAPDFIKLDTSLTRGIDRDSMRRALAAALISFGRQTNCRIVAEGVETGAELETLRDLGVHAAQGYHLGRPVPIEGLRRLLTGTGTSGSSADRVH